MAAASMAISNAVGGFFDARNPVIEETGRRAFNFTEIARAFTHGVTQGALVEGAGGEFRSGFAGAFAGSIVGSIQGAGVGRKFFGTPRDGSNKIVHRTVAAPVGGGTVSKIGGGKFANGAATAAMVHLFNTEGVLSKKEFNNGDEFLRERAYPDDLLRIGTVVDEYDLAELTPEGGHFLQWVNASQVTLDIFPIGQISEIRAVGLFGWYDAKMIRQSGIYLNLKSGMTTLVPEFQYTESTLIHVVRRGVAESLFRQPLHVPGDGHFQWKIESKHKIGYKRTGRKQYFEHGRRLFRKRF